MTEDVSAGRLVAEVVSDTSGFARDAKKKIDAEVRAIKARIKVEIDSRGTVTQARKVAQEASKAAIVRLKVELDTKGLIGQARAAAKLASAAAVVKLKAEVDTAQVATKVKAAAAAASAETVHVGVDADTTGAETQVEGFRKRQEKKPPVKLPFGIDPKGLNQAATALTKLSIAPAIAGGVFLLGTAVVQLGGGLFAVTSAASQAVGVLAIIPNLVGVVAQGAASLLVGFSGVGNVIGLMSKAEDAATTSTAASGAQAKATARAVESAMRQRERAAQSVKDAQQSLGDAQKAADDQSVSGARAVADARRALADARAEAADRERAAIETVSDAEWSLARAQDASADAQKALSNARIAAKKNIDDLNAALKAGALDEEEASLAVAKAEQNLQDVNWNGASSDLDKSEAQLAVKQAQERLDTVKKSNKDVAAEAAKANKAGVEGADNVKGARDQVRDALHAEQEDTENLANAQRDLTKSQVDSARAIELAQRGLSDAIKQNKDGEIAAARAIEQAGRGVVEAKQSYADAVQAVADANQTAASGGTKAAAAQTALQAALAKMSPAAQRFAKFIFGLKPQWEGLRNAVQAALLPPLQNGITKALPLLATLRKGLVGSATVVGGLGEKLGAVLGAKDFNNDVGTIMASNNRAMSSLGDTGLNVIQILRHLAVAAGPLVERFAAWTATLTSAWAEEAKTGRESGKLEKWLDKAGDTAALLGSILKNVVVALFGMGKAAAPAGLDLLKTLDKVTKKWSDFANSDEGQAKMKEFFDATKPVTEEVGKLVVNLVNFITKAGEGGGGSLTGFLQTLNFILGALNKIMSIPGAAPAIGALLTLAGVGGALGLVAGAVLKVGANVGKLGKFTGLTKLIGGIRGAKDAIDDELPADKEKKEVIDDLDESADKTGKTLGGKFVSGVKAAKNAVVSGAKAFAGWVAGAAKATAGAVAFTAKLVAQRVAAAAMAVWSGIVRVATLAWTAAQWLLNIALSPIGLIVIAIVAAIGLLVLGFIYAWKHSETFRKIVTGALNALKTVALAVFKGLAAAVKWVIAFVGDHWKLIVGYLGGPLVAAALLIITHWDKIKAAFSAAIGVIWAVLKGTWSRVSALLQLPVYIAIALIKLAWRGITAAFTAAKDWVIGTFRTAWSAVTGILTGAVDGAVAGVKAAWGWITSAFTTAKDWVVSAFKTAWAAVAGVLSGPVDSAKRFIATRLTNIQTNFTAVKDWVVKTFAQAWAAVKDKLSGPVDAAKKFIATRLTNIQTNFTALKDWVLKTFAQAWAALKGKLTGPISDAKAAIATVLGAAKGGLQWVFKSAVDAITKIWDGLKVAAKAPIKFIVDTVLNDGLIGAFNWVAGKVGAPTMDPIPLPKGFEDGGFNNGEFSGKIRGRKSSKDNLVARGPLGQRVGLATGEFITKAKETAKNLPLLRAINNGQISSRVSQMIQGGFADGGVFGGIKNFISGAASKGKELGGDILNVLKDPAAWFKQRMTGPLDRMKELGDSQFVQTVKAIPTKLVDVVAGKAKSILSGLGGGDGGGGGPINPGLAGALNWVKTQVGKPYLWGGVGPDGYDCSGLMGAIVNVIKGAEDPFKRLFSTGTLPTGLFEKGPGAFSIGWFKGNPGHTAGTLNGVNVESSGGRGVHMGKGARGATDSLFNSGVYHLKGYAKGGIFGDPPFDLIDPRGKHPLPNAEQLMRALGVTFDTGGFVSPGDTLVRNKTGEHEAMFQPGAWKGAASLLDQIFGIGRAIRASDDDAAGTSAAPLVGNLSVSVGDKDDLPDALDEVTHRLRVIDRGGVYANRTP